jgi:hypothetical protein
MCSACTADVPRARGRSATRILLAATSPKGGPSGSGYRYLTCINAKRLASVAKFIGRSLLQLQNERSDEMPETGVWQEHVWLCPRPRLPIASGAMK